MNNIPAEVISDLAELFPFGLLCFHFGKGKPEMKNAVCVYVNDEFYYSTGFQPIELEQRHYEFYDMIADYDREDVIQKINYIQEHIGEKRSADFEIPNAMGERQHLHCTMKFITDNEQDVYLLITVFNVEYFIKTQETVLQTIGKINQNKGMSGYLIKNQPGDAAVLRICQEKIQIADMNQGFVNTLKLSWPKLMAAGGFQTLTFPKKEDTRFMTFLNAAYKNRSATKSPKRHEFRIYDGKNQLRWLEGKCSYLETKDGYPYFLISIWDVDGRKHMEEELRVQAEQYKMLKDLTDEYLFSYDIENDRFLLPKELILKKELKNQIDCPLSTFLSFIHEEDRKLFEERILAATIKSTTGVIEVRINVAKKDVSPKYEWKRIHYKSIPGLYGKILKVIGRTMDITEEKQEKERLEDKAERDEMTHLLNKTTTEQEVKNYLRNVGGGTHALLIIDIDDFKMINDSFGHLYGDTVICSIAENINKMFRSTDIVGRIGGDEFLILMKNVTTELAVSVGRSVCNAVRDVLRNEKEDVKVSCSIGLSIYPENGTTYNRLFKKAELAMYQVKTQGKDECLRAQKWQPNLAETTEYNTKRDSGYGIVKNLTPEFVSYCFGLLAETKDVNAAINMILKRVGELSGLGAVCMYEFDKETDNVNRTNQWTRIGGISQFPQMSFHELSWLLSNFDENGIYAVNDCMDTSVDEIDQACYRSVEQIHSIIYIRFNGTLNDSGCLCLQDLEKPRIWTNAEKETAREFAHLLSIFAQLRKQTDEEKKTLVRLQNCDHLTGLMLEEVFIANVNKCRKNQMNKLSVIAYSDIDGFSYVNENFGNEAGNQLLKEFARLIRAEIKDALVSRVFTDFFVVYFQVERKQEAVDLLTEIEHKFAKGVRKYYPSGNLRLSTGIYFGDEPNVSTEVAIENANFARKRAKSIGPGNISVYDTDMRKQRNYDQMVAGDFRKALEEKQIEVYLQPKFDLETNRIYGAEALARWNMPDGSIRQPISFIPQLERIGYITDLDFFVYEQVLKRLSLWISLEISPMPISVNFSRRHFDSDGFYQKVVYLAEKYKVPYSLIEIELTESLLSQRHTYVIEQMHLLRQKGFRIAIDDFGTGYSSLSTLIDIPADVVKIDKSFLHREDLEERRRFTFLLGEMIHSTNEELVCEGIETEEQVQFLRDCGFKYGQGYIFDKPIRISDFERKYLDSPNKKFMEKNN